MLELRLFDRPQISPKEFSIFLINKVEAEEGITHILVEENSVKAFAETLARETGLATLPVSPLGRGTLDPSKDFFDVMNTNLNSFKIALNCQ